MLESDCTYYYKIYYEYNDKKYVFHYLNSCCNSRDNLFEAKSIEEIMKILSVCVLNYSQNNKITYDDIEKICWNNI